MKKESLFLLFIVIPLCAIASKKDQNKGQKRWQLTHVIRVCNEEVANGEILCMYPKRPSSDEEEKLEEELRWLDSRIHSVCEECESEKVVGLNNKREELEEELERVNKKQNDYLDNLSDDDVLKQGLACRINNYVFRIATQKKKCIGPELAAGIPTYYSEEMAEWPPRRGYPSDCCSRGARVICNTRHTQEKVELKESNLIIDNSNGQKVKVSLSELPKEARSIKSTTTYGNKKGDKIAVLCSTGEVLILARKNENHEKPIIIDGAHYKKQIRNIKRINILLTACGIVGLIGGIVNF